MPETSQTIAQKRETLASMYYIRRFMDDTLQKVLARLHAAWEELAPEAQTEIEAKQAELANKLENAANAFERGNHIEAFFRALEGMDAVLAVAYDEIKNGKTAERFRNTSGPDAATNARIIDALRAPVIAMERVVESIAFPDLPALEAAVEATLNPTPTQFYTRVDFPARVENTAEKEHALIVQLVLNRPQSTAVAGVVDVSFADPALPEIVEVIVSAPGFTERTGIWSRTIAVYTYQDSQPAIFLLKLADTALQTRFLTLDFYHKGRTVGTFIFKTEVTGRLFTHSVPLSEGTAKSDGETEPPITLGSAVVERAVDGIRLGGGDAPPVDMELRIVRENNELHFSLRSAKAILGYHDRAVGSLKLSTADPTAFFEKHFARLSQLAAQPVSLEDAESQDYQTELEDMGYELYRDLFPKELKSEYWKLHALNVAHKQSTSRPLSLMITSDEPWVPWEMVSPFEDSDHTSDFLAAEFELSRWLAGRGPAAALTINAARLVAPDLDLDFVEQEREYFTTLAAQGVEVGDPIETHANLLALAQKGGVQMLHFATHGNFNKANVGDSPISLQDRPLIPRDFNKRRVAGLLRERPLVFFNTCHGGKLGFDLIGLGGWAQQLIDEVGVTAFIGTHWEVNDRLAAIFSRAFYDALLSKQSLGAAFHTARLAVRAKQPGNPTWLAYTLYGDPNSRVVIE